ncbi:MAG: molecular chaperone DnaJ [Herbaspirillum sp.]|uniref:hypothetical protein n=1 Tax=Herbaspirillum sp. TaxID=1890675 RepID=UPI0025896435|nr:hypothetical protein [Herbaspirillum sp.]MCP3653353.1 molecular chaperone DnaJ [Herbaspirillum sp.]MCP3946765.1 molecular chaperone DnaJ [Herbaspirillum sp.]MCP4031241.1 molecular chaperone DnaJ [Herbaspirillum sp.]MCP4554386.1 molecular chaperone DnaJ [Herbaspirillum sp.]
MSAVKCPKCGSDSGYYTKRRVTLNTAYDFSGEAWDSEVHNDSNNGGKIKRCCDCRKNITAFVDGLPAEAGGKS